MEEVLASSEAKAAVLISSKPGCFIAGADVKWLDAAKSKQDVNKSTLSVCGYLFALFASVVCVEWC